MVHLGDFAKRRPHELSGGMRQRAALARALAQDADVLLMDEPFGALDAMTRDLLHDELEALWTSTGKTVIFVTHNVREAVRLGDCVVLLASRPGTGRGRLQRHDPPPAAHRLTRSRDTRRDDHRPTARGGEPWPSRLTSSCIARRRRAGDQSHRNRSRPRAWNATWPKLLAIAIVILGWQIVVWLQLKPEYLVPSPFTVFDQFFHDLRQAADREPRHAAPRRRWASSLPS